MKKNKTRTLLVKERQRYAKIFSIDVIIRILSTLRENGRLNRTNLAGKTGLNYKQCVKYIALLQTIEWVRVIIDRNHYTIITERGIEIIEKFQNF